MANTCRAMLQKREEKCIILMYDSRSWTFARVFPLRKRKYFITNCIRSKCLMGNPCENGVIVRLGASRLLFFSSLLSTAICVRISVRASFSITVPAAAAGKGSSASPSAVSSPDSISTASRNPNMKLHCFIAANIKRFAVIKMNNTRIVFIFAAK